MRVLSSMLTQHEHRYLLDCVISSFYCLYHALLLTHCRSGIQAFIALLSLLCSSWLLPHGKCSATLGNNNTTDVALWPTERISCKHGVQGQQRCCRILCSPEQRNVYITNARVALSDSTTGDFSCFLLRPQQPAALTAVCPADHPSQLDIRRSTAHHRRLQGGVHILCDMG